MGVLLRITSGAANDVTFVDSDNVIIQATGSGNSIVYHQAQVAGVGVVAETLTAISGIGVVNPADGTNSPLV